MKVLVILMTIISICMISAVKADENVTTTTLETTTTIPTTSTSTTIPVTTTIPTTTTSTTIPTTTTSTTVPTTTTTPTTTSTTSTTTTAPVTTTTIATTSTTTTTIPVEIINVTEFVPQEVTYQNLTELTVIGSNLTATDVEGVINKLLDLYKKNYTQALVQLDVFQKMWDASCMYSESRFEDFYKIYMGMSDIAKECFSKFITENATNALFFSQSCSATTGNSYLADQILNEYLKNNLAERQCIMVQLPIVSQSSTGQAVAGTTQYQQCNYYPTRVPLGCLNKVAFINAGNDKKWQEGFVDGFGVMFAICLLIIFILFVRSSGD